MAVPSSGQLRLRADIANEVDGSDTGTNVSLGTLSNTAGFTEPDKMSDFYGYVSYQQPTTSGSPTTSNVYDTQMTVTSTTFSNPSGGSVERGFYFGTSSTMASNTWYSKGNTSSTSFDFDNTFTGLTASTTYYVWAGIRDTEDPARFTATYSSSKTQATGAAYTYTTYTVNNKFGFYHEYYPPNVAGKQRGYCQYNSYYYGWTTVTHTSHTQSTGNPGSTGSGWGSQGAWGAGYLSGGAATNNRTVGDCEANDNNSSGGAIGQQFHSRVDLYLGVTSITGSSHFNGGCTGTVTTQNGGGNASRYGWSSSLNYNTNSMRYQNNGTNTHAQYVITLTYDV